MAHGIVTEGVVADRVLIEGDKGWHGLGENRDKITPEDVRKAFPWEYEMESVQTSAGATVPNFKAVTSEGNPIGIVGDGYTMIGLEDAIALAEECITQHGTGRIVSAGTLHGRQDFFIDLELDKEYRNGNDVNKPFIGFSNNAVGNRHFVAGAHMRRMVCANTLNLMLNEVKGSPRALKIRHTKSAHNRLTEAKRILGITCAAFDKADEEMQALIAKTLTDAEVKSYYDKIMPFEPLPVMSVGQSADAYESAVEKVERANRKVERARDSWIATLEMERIALGGGSPTLWLAMNSVTKWTQHERTVRGESTDPTMRLWSNRFSDGYDRTNEAHDIAVAML
jgi:phage/plasmid-like protein (TIGR03299 family)